MHEKSFHNRRLNESGATSKRCLSDRKHQLDFSEVSNFARLISPTEHMSKIINVPIKLYRSKY